jgi:2-phosphoglycolate phosphatase
MTAADLLLIDTVQAVLFDLDGTLLDTARDLVGALHVVCTEENLPAPPLELASQYVSTGAIGLVRLASPAAHDDELERLRARLVTIYEGNICNATAPYPGVIELLADIESRNIPWGIVTNKLRYLAEPILAELGLAARYATLVGGTCAGHNKPHPAPINKALAELNVPAHKAVYVGDAGKDIVAGQAAGTATVAVTWGYTLPGEEPHSWGADYTIDTPQALLKVGAMQ